MFVSFKYERLPRIYFSCGLITHNGKVCIYKEATINSKYSSFTQYGPLQHTGIGKFEDSVLTRLPQIVSGKQIFTYNLVIAVNSSNPDRGVDVQLPNPPWFLKNWMDNGFMWIT